jgi:hypothetical protein
MPNVATVTLTVNTAALLPAANAAFKQTTITVTDANSAVQTANVNGTETPLPWVAVFQNVAAGAGTASAQAFDVDNVAIGPPVSTTFTEVGSPPATFPQPMGISVAVS